MSFLSLLIGICLYLYLTHALTKQPYDIGEEDVPPGKEASAAAIDAKLQNNPSNYLWIVNPIDGTFNFVHGMPLCMPSIAVAYKGEVVVVSSMIQMKHSQQLEDKVPT